MSDKMPDPVIIEWTNEQGTFEIEGDFICHLNCGFTWHAKHRTDDPEEEYCPECKLGEMPSAG